MKKIFLFILIIGFIPAIANAALLAPSKDSYKLLEPLPCIEGTNNTCTNGVIKEIALNDYIGYIFKFSIALAAFLAVVMIIWGGFQYMTSESPFGKTDGKARITNAIMGLVGVVASYLVLATIDPRLVEIDTSIPKIVVDTSDVTEFETGLNRDIQALSVETQAKIKQNLADIDTLNNKKAEIMKQCENGELSEDDCSIELAKIRNDVQKLTTTQHTLFANDSGLLAFGKAYEIIHNPGTESADNNYKLALEQINGTGNIFDAEIKAIGNNDPSAVQSLKKQQAFYVNQLTEEKKLADSLSIRKNIGTPAGPGYVQLKNMLDANTAELSGKIVTYQNNMKDPQKAADAGVSQTQYNQLMQRRIDEIKTALTPTK